MKLILCITCWVLSTAAFSQNVTSKKEFIINVPDFSNAETKNFYTSYAAHLLKCIEAIRQKDEPKAMALLKAGEALVTKEKKLTQEVIKDPVEKKKYLEFATEVYPYLKELEQSEYYKKISVKK